MITIEFHGFRPDATQIKERARKILEKQCSAVNKEIRTEIVTAICEDSGGDLSPYIRVASDKMGSEAIARLLEQQLHLEVQWLRLGH